MLIFPVRFSGSFWGRKNLLNHLHPGLEHDKDTLLEVAVIVTEGDLSVVAEGPNLVIHQPDEVLDSMNEWCKEHHGQSGLTQAVRDSKVTSPFTYILQTPIRA